jgi:hypothetical protein
MRTSILVWSGFSGAVLGIFVDAILIGIALLASAVVPGVYARFSQRWVSVAAIAILAAIPAAAAVLGILEGRLKAS